MVDKKITIAIDAMGGDDSPFKILKGTEIFLQNNQEVNIVFLGEEDLLNEIIQKKKIRLFNYSIINTENNVEDNDSPSIILRQRKDSSIKKGLELIKDISDSGFVSAGNTGAIMMLSKLTLGMIEGIERPAICSMIPNEKGFSILLDLGANTNCDKKNLFQFALMGYCYYRIINPNINPTLSILNIGIEKNKGKEYLQECMSLINNSFLKSNFLGFIEPNKIFSGESDIMITDGFTGNMIIKTAEGLSTYIMKNIKNIFASSFKNKLAYKIIENDFRFIKDKINPDKYDGAILLGVNGISIKSHGNSNSYAVAQAINRCHKFIINDLNSQIREKLIQS